MINSEYRENAIRKDWRYIDVSFGLIYPNMYRIGMSSYSIRFLYSYLNSYENVACERIFLPENIRYPAAEDINHPDILRSIENKIHPTQFDILGFSLQYENDFKNVLWMLEKAGIPLTWQERDAANVNPGDKYPLIIAGGPVATSNPIPFSDIFDVFFIGDAEPNLDYFLQNYLDYKNSSDSKEHFYQSLLSHEGFYISCKNNTATRAILDNLDDSPIFNYYLISNSSKEKKIFQNSYILEINRGCPFQCKFCISSHHNSPFRNRSYESISKAIDDAIKSFNFSKITLIGSCVSAHPQFLEICKEILSHSKKFRIPSIRIDHITPQIISLLERNGTRTITIAPETGSEHLRFNIGKRITNEIFLSKIKLIHQSKIKSVKMYFLIGLPNETEIDLHGIINLMKEISDLGFSKGSLKVSINPFIPKLNTPYEKQVKYYFSDHFQSLADKFEFLKSQLNKIPSISLKIPNIKHLLKSARLQTLISLGDKEIGVLLRSYYPNGADFGALRKAEDIHEFVFDDYLDKIENCYSPWKFNK